MEVRLVVCGDDFTLSGSEEELDWFRKEIIGSTVVEFTARPGPESKNDQSFRIVNRLVQWARLSMKRIRDKAKS